MRFPSKTSLSLGTCQFSPNGILVLVTGNVWKTRRERKVLVTRPSRRVTEVIWTLRENSLGTEKAFHLGMDRMVPGVSKRVLNMLAYPDHGGPRKCPIFLLTPWPRKRK